jgi:hypothetical protein
VNKEVLTGGTAATFGDDFRTPIPGYGTDVSGQSNSEYIAFQVEFVQGCTNIDTDGDGVLDYLDLDSDNDGIYDLVEAGHGGMDADVNGVLDGAFAAFGDNGFFNSLEAAPESGIPNYTPLDSDVDGTLDAQEIDSDDDGCFDVAEAGFSDADLDGQVDGSGVDANGVVIGSDGYSGTDPRVTDFSLVALSCDTDSDGINPLVDLDDDNDGIPDLEELDCSSAFIPANSGGYALNTDFSGASPLSGMFAYNGNEVDFSYALQGTATWDSGVEVENNGALAPDGDYINVQPRDTDLINGDVAVYTLGFSQPVTELEFKWAGLDNGDMTRFRAFYAGNELTVTQADITNLNIPAANFSFYDANTVESVNGAGNAPNNAVLFSSSALINQIILTAGKNSASTNPVTMQLYEMRYCNLRDTDMDGVIDKFDLDSDNDGIYDLIEAGHGQADADQNGRIDGVPAAFGTNGLFDGLEITTDSGTLNYTVSDSDSDGIIDAIELDSDDDGCFDVIEAGFDDPDGNGLLGTGN